MELFRHPSGLYYSRQFAEFLRQKQEAESSEHPGELLSIEYVSCREGEEAGKNPCPESHLSAPPPGYG